MSAVDATNATNVMTDEKGYVVVRDSAGWQRRWFEVREELVALAQVLDDSGFFDTTRDVVYFLEKPWKWSPEYERWVRAGRPAELDPFEDDEEPYEVVG